MAQISPWSVKGVAPEDREAAKRAARQAGLPVGAWLSQAIRYAGHEPGGGLTVAAQPPDSERAAEILELRAEVAALTGRLKALREDMARQRADIAALGESRTAVAAPDPLPAGTTPEIQASQAALERAVLRLSDRLLALEEASRAARGGPAPGFLKRFFGAG